MENTELHLEEQRQILLDINKGIKEFKEVLQGQIDITVNQPDKMTVNTETEVDVKNLSDMKEWVDNLGDVVSKAIKDNSYKPVSEVSIKNAKDILPSKLTISNLSDIKAYFSDITRAIENNQPVVNITKQDIVFPRSAKDAIPVRLSDGKGFYNAITAAISSAGNGQAHLHVGGNPVTTANPIPVDIQDASVTINGDVTVLSEVEVKNDSGNPVPVSASSLPLPTGASTSAKQDTAQASLSSIDTKLTDNATQTTLATRLSESDFDTKIGSLTETAPTTDTASSGLNGRLQRLAQRLTSIIALLPGSLGQKARAASLAVTLSSEDVTALTPPAAITGFATQTTLAALLAELQLKADLTETQPVSLASVPSHAVTNVGTFAVQAAQSGTWNIGTVTTLTGITNNVNTVEVAPTTILNGNKNVTTAGTRVTLASSTSCKSVTIKAKVANTGTIYVGDTSVSSSNGFALAAGETVSLDIANLNTVNLDASVSGEGVTYVGVN